MINFILKIILVLVYIVVFIPIGIIMRFFRVDYMGLNNDSKKDSYWIKR